MNTAIVIFWLSENVTNLRVLLFAFGIVILTFSAFALLFYVAHFDNEAMQEMQARFNVTKKLKIGVVIGTIFICLNIILPTQETLLMIYDEQKQKTTELCKIIENV